MRWIEEIRQANDRFRETLELEALPEERQPCPYAIITCMDPRLNLAAVGRKAFGPNGTCHSQIRVIRTIGAMSESRSLIVGIHLAGFKEIAVVMHTDCGCSLAHDKIDTIVANMEASLSPEKLKRFRVSVGEPFRTNLKEQLRTFTDPWDAVKREVEAIKSKPFVPESVAVHGIVYELTTGIAHVVVNGHDADG